MKFITPAFVIAICSIVFPFFAFSTVVKNEIYAFDRDGVVIVLRERIRLPGPQVPYSAEPGDSIKNGNLIRGDQTIGVVSGKYRDRLTYNDSLIGVTLDPKLLESEDSYKLSINGTAVDFEIIGRQSKPTGLAMGSLSKTEGVYEHRIYLKLSHNLKPGDTVSAIVPNSLPTRRVWDAPATPGALGTDVPKTDTVDVVLSSMQRSPAVNVNHVGFRPIDPLKRGYYGIWLGTGGACDLGERNFRVVCYPGGEEIFKGRSTMAMSPESAESVNGVNHTKTWIYHCDFSELNEPGTYLLTVDGIGSSYPFVIEDRVWIEPVKTIAEGFLTQRSGIELGPPHTRYVRPRPFHPDDGLEVYISTTPLMDTKNGLNALGTDKTNFGNLLAGRTNEKLEKVAVGGYFDAGDWDRRIQHLEASRQMVELFEMFPRKLEGMLFNIPETGNGIPDILNEVLFNVDFYRQLQTPQGGIRGGIESEEHPLKGERSWQESLEVLTYAPGVWSSYLYAATAAQVSPLLKAYNTARAQELLKSAKLAWDWAEKELPELESTRDSIPDDVYQARLLAALHLFRATGDDGYHELFKKEVAFAEGTVEITNDRLEEAAFYYAFFTEHTDESIRQYARESLLKRANFVLDTVNSTGYGWALKNGNATIDWGKSIIAPPNTLARAYHLTHDTSYLRGLIDSAQYGAGANPYNQCMVTGVGHDWPRSPLVVDTKQSLNPPPGIVLYGPIEPRNFNPWFLDEIEPFVAPAYADWPLVHFHWDMWLMVPVNEYTMHETMGPGFFAWGYLALYE